MDETYDYLSADKMRELKELCKELIGKRYKISDLVGCIYELYQEYILSEEQERELYNLVDPAEQFNNCSEYWEQITQNPLLKYVR